MIIDVDTDWPLIGEKEQLLQSLMMYNETYTKRYYDRSRDLNDKSIFDSRSFALGLISIASLYVLLMIC